ncbi:MAG TPA: hypothetical protein VE987_06530 [Polyangiaceae bacterium]|nr:hypothetical protein [Polyangiaceae bacterium]
MTARLLALVALACSCARAAAPPPAEGASGEPRPSTATASAAEASSTPTGSVASGDAAVASAAQASGATAAGPDGSSASANGATTEPAVAGEDFIDEARVLFRVAACGGPGGAIAGSDGGDASEPLPARFDPAVVGRHCDELGRAYRDYQRSWVDVAEPFIASLRPGDLPRRVVYPFGGGDLASAMATFPDATEITTISLEPAGDVRPVDKLPGDRLAHELAEHRAHLERLFEKAHSRTDNLEKESKTELPGEVIFALAALAVHGDEPVSLRYFRLLPDGAIAYVTKADIDATTGAERRALFSNVELRFRRAGAPDAPVRVVRHISFNLDDAHLRSDPSLVAHLSAKGKVAAMTKAASHLLWNDHFSLIRGWLIDHTDWMISDSTGIPPRFAAPAGFVQDTYGTFAGPAPFGLLDARDAADFKKLFASEPARELAFRYGYPDKDGHGHLIVTRRPPGGAGAVAEPDSAH